MKIHSRIIAAVLFFLCLTDYVLAYITPMAMYGAWALLVLCVLLHVWYFLRQDGGWAGVFHLFIGVTQSKKALLSGMAGLEIISLVLTQNAPFPFVTAILFAGGLLIYTAFLWAIHGNIFMS